MDNSQIVALYWQRDEQAIVETDAKYGSYCMKISQNILSDRAGRAAALQRKRAQRQRDDQVSANKTKAMQRDLHRFFDGHTKRRHQRA